MPKKQLRELLDQLDLELDTVHKLDESGREKMQALRKEMQQVLERTAPAGADEDDGARPSVHLIGNPLLDCRVAALRDGFPVVV